MEVKSAEQRDCGRKRDSPGGETDGSEEPGRQDWAGGGAASKEGTGGGGVEVQRAGKGSGAGSGLARPKQQNPKRSWDRQAEEPGPGKDTEGRVGPKSLFPIYCIYLHTTHPQIPAVPRSRMAGESQVK